MKQETIQQHGEDVGLRGARLNRFVHFFSNRFPDESEEITCYVREWANRFLDDPVPRMDSKSREVYYSYFDEVEKND
jgi:hypothetical protein